MTRYNKSKVKNVIGPFDNVNLLDAEKSVTRRKERMRLLLITTAAISTVMAAQPPAGPPVRDWDALRTALNGLCPEEEKDGLRYCPLITASKGFLVSCPGVIETMHTALGAEEQKVMTKYVHHLCGALKSLGPKPIKEKDEEKKRKLEEKRQKEYDALSAEKKAEHDWGKEMSRYGVELERLLKDGTKAKEATQCAVESLVRVLQHMKDKKAEKARIDFLAPLERVLDRLVMLERSGKLDVGKETAEGLKKMAEAVDQSRPFHQRTAFIVIVTLALLGIMSLMVGGYLVKMTRQK